MNPAEVQVSTGDDAYRDKHAGYQEPAGDRPPRTADTPAEIPRTQNRPGEDGLAGAVHTGRQPAYTRVSETDSRARNPPANSWFTRPASCEFGYGFRHEVPALPPDIRYEHTPL